MANSKDRKADVFAGEGSIAGKLRKRRQQMESAGSSKPKPAPKPAPKPKPWWM